MNNKPNYTKGTRKDLIILLHKCGAISYKALEILGEKYPKAWLQQTANKLKRENIVSIKSLRKSNRNISFINYLTNKEVFKDAITEKESQYYLENHYKDLCLGDSAESISRGIHAVRNGEITALTDALGIDLSYEHTDKSNPQYLTSKELKKITDFKHDIVKNDSGDVIQTYTRILGLLRCDSGDYPIFNIQNKMVEWSQKGEIKMNVHLTKILGHKCDQAIIYTYDINNLYNIIKDDKNCERFSGIEDIYKTLYLLPYNQDGINMTRLILQKDWQIELKKSLIEDFTEPRGSVLDCDYYNPVTDEYTLIFCIPDIKKLRKFLIYAEMENNKSKFRIICFDFQKEVIARLGKDFTRIFTISLQEYIKESTR